MLAARHRGTPCVEDASREVFWNFWRESDGVGNIMMLNTDWASPGEAKTVVVRAPSGDFEARVVERSPKIITILPSASIEASPQLHVEIVSVDNGQARLRIHGCGRGELVVHAGGSSKTVELYLADAPFQDWTMADGVGLRRMR